mmetsp:Transcript_99126/g.159839  ORF Transcript_99126/g.159839 Transcript_99126/m.159839 type:complete len:215 (-) Transcript_99126:85-729(-)
MFCIQQCTHKWTVPSARAIAGNCGARARKHDRILEGRGLRRRLARQRAIKRAVWPGYTAGIQHHQKHNSAGLAKLLQDRLVQLLAQRAHERVEGQTLALQVVRVVSTCVTWDQIHLFLFCLDAVPCIVEDKEQRGVLQQTRLLQAFPHTPYEVASGGCYGLACHRFRVAVGCGLEFRAHCIGVSHRVAEVANVRIFVHANAQPGHAQPGPTTIC